ncbi:MAG TPA: L,D-transpeptidase, partial [Verrucomicrobiae bacterium]|nr:L,D-transpeptidase [Verrucomicrobiae bacterium]
RQGVESREEGTLTPSLSHTHSRTLTRPSGTLSHPMGEGRGEGAFLNRPKPQQVPCPGGYQLVNSFRCSTSRFGIGQLAGSNRTPIGLHRIAQKLGGGWPAGTVFKSRHPVGFTWQGQPEATITSRILWLEGLDPGWNQGGNVDSHARYIYIHGTGDELTIGSPASCGCLHLSCEDLLPLFDLVPVGSLVWIRP